MVMDEIEENFVKNLEWLKYLEEDKNIVTSMALFQALEQLKEKKDFDSIIRFAVNRYQRLIKNIERKNEIQEYVKFFKYLELNHHFSGSSPLFPEYVLLPPAILFNKKTIANKYSAVTNDGMKLFNAGILPLDPRIAEKVMPKEMLSEARKPMFVDIDYFLLLNEKSHNFFLGIGLMAAHIKEFPSLIQRKEDILNIGSIRAHQIVNNDRSYGKAVLAPVSYEVSCRKDLDILLKGINDAADKAGLEMWFRGQPNKYLLPDMAEESKKGFVRYRNIQDCCLWPSLYRSVQKDVTEINEYAKKCAALSYYSFLMSQYLDLDENEVLNSIEDPVFGANSLENFENPLRYQVIQRHTNGTDEVTLKQMNPVTTSLRKVLFLQHYGLPSNILDITNNIDVALFFSQMKVHNGSYVLASPGKSVIYIFLLNPKTDMMLNSTELLKNTSLLRPQRQHCGILYGASMVNRNHYSRYVSIEITLKSKIEMHKTTNELFPKRDEDHFLNFFLNAKANNESATVAPFDPI
jgi:hypothetical protein